MKPLSKILNMAKYFVGMTQSRIKERLNTNWLYSWLHYLLDQKRECLLSPQNKHVILVNTPIHPNLGDQAIAVAEIQFLKDFFPKYELVELNDDEIFKKIVQMKKEIREGDLIFCHGGGNMGVDYYWCEKVRRVIISNFPSNKIVVFPQTIFYDNHYRRSHKELAKSVRIYNAHPKLYLCARENQSYRTMNELFMQCSVGLFPDIVLYLQPTLNVVREHNRALVCLRNDRERSISSENEYAILHYLEQKSYNVIRTDTVLRGKICPQNRNQIVLDKIREFAAADLVITDRLHGMVFSYLAKTPCVVFGNYNHKVEGVYEWFKGAQVGSIIFCADIDDLECSIQSVIDWNGSVNKPFANEYQKLYQFISSNK